MKTNICVNGTNKENRVKSLGDTNFQAVMIFVLGKRINKRFANNASQ